MNKVFQIVQLVSLVVSMFKGTTTAPPATADVITTDPKVLEIAGKLRLEADGLENSIAAVEVDLETLKTLDLNITGFDSAITVLNSLAGIIKSIEAELPAEQPTTPPAQS